MKKRISKERKDLEETLIILLRNYKNFQGTHFENIDQEIERMVEALKKEV